VTGQSLGTFFRDEVALPLNADFHIGFAAPLDARVGEMIPAAVRVSGDSRPNSLLSRVISNPPFDSRAANSRAWRAAEIPAANGHGNARSCARVMSALACGGEIDGVRLISTATLERAIEEQCHRPDLVLRIPMRWALGYMLAGESLPFGFGPRTFGHGGAGGSLAIADLDARVSWAYVMNVMGATTIGDQRGLGLGQAFYESFGKPVRV
jgi:CubicO group peptidase (beta-lactamase class C family)